MKSIVERGRPQTTIWRMRIAWCIPKATNTHSQYVILIAFPLQQWLHERVSLLPYTYTACIVMFHTIITMSSFYRTGKLKRLVFANEPQCAFSRISIQNSCFLIKFTSSSHFTISKCGPPNTKNFCLLSPCLLRFPQL